jgi:hypothetical protein
MSVSNRSGVESDIARRPLGKRRDAGDAVARGGHQSDPGVEQRPILLDDQDRRD